MSISVAYADPPYPGQSDRYKGHPDFGGEVDHHRLISKLVNEYPDGWALSTNVPSLAWLLPICPPEVRVGVWVKHFVAHKPHVRVAYAWEPVIFLMPERRAGTVPTRDFVVERITMKKGLHGRKPARFCVWMFNFLGLLPGDNLDDLYPGSGIVSKAFSKWSEAGGPKLQQRINVGNEWVHSPEEDDDGQA